MPSGAIQQEVVGGASTRRRHPSLSWCSRPLQHSASLIHWRSPSTLWCPAPLAGATGVSEVAGSPARAGDGFDAAALEEHQVGGAVAAGHAGPVTRANVVPVVAGLGAARPTRVVHGAVFTLGGWRGGRSCGQLDQMTSLQQYYTCITYITPILKSLARCRLPSWWISYIGFKALNGLIDQICFYCMRSSASGLLMIPIVRTKTHSHASFFYYGPAFVKTPGWQKVLPSANWKHLFSF